jgi:hypothetical protein
MGIYVIKGKFATLNEHDGANRSNRFMGAKLKHDMTDMVAWQLTGKPTITAPCIPAFEWLIHSRADYDNIGFARKYVLDGMVKSGVLPDDNQKWVRGFGGEIFTHVEKGQEGVIVTVVSA